METCFCQSCGMPIQETSQQGSNGDGTPTNEYCTYCYKDGKFTQDISMEEMIQHCLQYLDEFNKDSETQYSREGALKEMREYFPHLKRWKQ